MAATTTNHLPATPGPSFEPNGHGYEDDDANVFLSDRNPTSQSFQHRFSSQFDAAPLDLSSTNSPSQLKRTIEAHLQETDRRLLDTQHLGNSLLRQRDDLATKLEEVEHFQDEATVPNELRRKLAEIEREHADVGREVARALIGPKAKQLDEAHHPESAVFTSQATGSPTKVSAPSRRHRNQPSTRAGDLQFAADISTSLLAQVRQLQAAVAERDETLKHFQAEREAIEHDLAGYTQKVRALDESEQKFKDENWTLETQKHDLLNAAKDAHDKEKRLHASLGVTQAERSRLQNDLDELKMAYSKLAEEHAATRKAHDTEIHGLKRGVDAADTERQTLQQKIEDLMAQNQELAKAVATRSRSRQISPGRPFSDMPEESLDQIETPDDSPPPSPTKATPRHGGLESETLRSSLTHAHRMIQNLKGNIHREKTEKIELKRMLQDARDELEHRRGSEGSAAKRQKTKAEAFRKPMRPDILGGNRRPRTDIQLTDDDWEDQPFDSPSRVRPTTLSSSGRDDDQRLTDQSDAYQTANDTEGTFDTADERNTTESEAFMTGAESLAGDSTDEMTETEDTTSRSGRPAPGRVARSLPATRPKTASTYGDEMEDLQTPVQPSFTKFKLRNNRVSYNKQNPAAQQATPESLRSEFLSEDSPATTTAGKRPLAGEQSLFAELGGMDEINSDTHSTPARSSTMSSTHSTPGHSYTPSKSAVNIYQSSDRPVMVDSSTMTDAFDSMPTAFVSRHLPGHAEHPEMSLMPSALPLPPSVPASPSKNIDHSTQYTPHRRLSDSPVRPTSSHITPPKTIWDTAHEPSSPSHDATENEGASRAFMGYSGVPAQDSLPTHSPTWGQFEQLHADLARKEIDLQALRNSHNIALANIQLDLDAIKSSHRLEIERNKELTEAHQNDVNRREAELQALQDSHNATLASLRTESDQLKAAHKVNLDELSEQISVHTKAFDSKELELIDARRDHEVALSSAQDTAEALHTSHARDFARLNNVVSVHQKDIDDKQDQLDAFRAAHAAVLASSAAELEKVKMGHSNELSTLKEQISHQQQEFAANQTDFNTLQTNHVAALAAKQAEIHATQSAHATEVENLKTQVNNHSEQLVVKREELNELRAIHSGELDKLRKQISGYDQDIGSKQTELEKLQSIHNTELESLRRQISGTAGELNDKQAELLALTKAHSDNLEGHKTVVAAHQQDMVRKQAEMENLVQSHGTEVGRLQGLVLSRSRDIASTQNELNGLQSEVSTHRAALENRENELNNLRIAHEDQVQTLRKQILTHNQALSDKHNEFLTLQKAREEEGAVLRAQVSTREQKLRSMQDDVATMRQNHEQEATRLRTKISGYGDLMERLQIQHEEELSRLRAEMAAKDAELARLQATLSDLEVRIAQNLPGYSSILSQETQSVSPQAIATESALSRARRESLERPRTAERIVGSNVLASAAGGLGFAAGQGLEPTGSEANERRLAAAGQSEDVFGGMSSEPHLQDSRGSQTGIPTAQMSEASKQKESVNTIVTMPIGTRSSGARTPTSPTRYPLRPSSRTRDVMPIYEDPDSALPSTPPPRPGSAGSTRTSSFLSQNHPPLPSDHKDIIAKANTYVGSPTRRDASVVKQGGIMGPPTMPASAMRRPKTPNESARTATRFSQHGKHATNGSHVSRRSSVSSFASELDERFNIRAGQEASAHGFEAGPGTDPRMIQAITQTMIGEYLWKYTRKAGSKEMSTTRHRRYFWVHPYTKTLYWSDQDPQTAGRSELKAKSVAIQSVRVVSDDNPLPPGLHRKSLEITTPGRKIKITASTGQRHETWFNALSYLLNRSEDQVVATDDATNGIEITRDDLAEFSVNGYGARLIPNESSMSMSSYNSRTTNNTSRKARQSLPAGATRVSSTSQAPQTPGVQSSSITQGNNDTIRGTHLEPPADQDRTLRASSKSRISKMFGSIASRSRSDGGAAESSTRARENSSIYDASIISDGGRGKEEEEEAMRQPKQEINPGLEDVRACCDGKHHVGTLTHRHVSNSGTQNRLSNAINRSMSRRT